MSNYYTPCFYRIGFVVIPFYIELPWLNYVLVFCHALLIIIKPNLFVFIFLFFNFLLLWNLKLTKFRYLSVIPIKKISTTSCGKFYTKANSLVKGRSVKIVFKLQENTREQKWRLLLCYSPSSWHQLLKMIVPAYLVPLSLRCLKKLHK